MSPNSSHSRPDFPRGGAAAVAAAAVAILATSVLVRLLSPTPPVWDDAYMFFRYAANFLNEGRLVWNPGGTATWGATSILYVGVVAASKLVGPDDPLQVLLIASLACGALSVLLMARLARAAGGGVLAFALAAIAFQARPFAGHLVSGMDTALGAAWLALFLLLAYRQRDGGTTAGSAALGCIGGLALFVRPELLLFSFAVPLGTALLSPDVGARRRARLTAVVTAAVLIGGLCAAAAGFGAPLPLPFYVKAVGVYGETMRATYEGIAVREAARFAAYNAPFAIAALAGALAWRRAAARPDLGIEAGLLTALVGFGTFHTLFVTPIMGYDARFLYPALPAVAALGCRGLALAGAGGRRLLAASALLLVWPLAVAARQAAADFRAGGRARPWTLEASCHAYADDWFALRRLRELPDDLVIATTEVGHPGALLPGKTIVDLAGLNDPMLTRSGLRSAEIFRHRPPDWIYLPHADYREFRRAIETDPFFLAHYEVFPTETLGMARVEAAGRVVSKPYWLDVAILRDGPHAATLRALLEEERRR